MLKDELRQLKIEADIKKYCSQDFYIKLNKIKHRCREAASSGLDEIFFDLDLLSQLNLLDDSIERHNFNIKYFSIKLEEQGLTVLCYISYSRNEKFSTLKVIWK